MIGDPALVLSWLLLAHLCADFLLQPERIAAQKFGTGSRAWTALLTHGGVVALTLAPVVLVFGLPGFAFLLVTALAHMTIDRTKVVLTRRAGSTALRTAQEDAPETPAATLGAAWTPTPGALFMADQVAHVVVLFLAWSAFLSGAVPFDVWTRATNALVGRLGPDTFHQVMLTGVIVTILLIVNVRAASLFVATLVEPQDSPSRATDRDAISDDARPARSAMASPARLGATIGVLERLVVVALVLAGQASAIGFVIAAKTLARFKQLDDRRFAEYYLLGTLASVAVALITALIAVAVLGAVLRR